MGELENMPSPPQSREHSPIRSQLPTSPLATRKVLSQLPQAPNRKHYLPGLSEPVAKRPTLAQRAGDFSSENAAAPPSQQPVNHAVTTTATAGPPRFNVSTSTRASPPRGRSLTSFSASVGPGVRPQNTITSTLPRPAAAHGRIPRQAKPTTNTKGTGLQIARQKSFTARGDTSAIPNGVSSARSLMTSSTREGSGQAPTAKAWDPDDMFASMERVMSESLGKLQQNTQESSSMKELLEMYKARYLESEKSLVELSCANQTLRGELEDISSRLGANLSETSTQSALHKQEVDHLHRINDDLRSHISTATSNATSLEITIEKLQGRITQLESENRSQSIQYAVLQEQMHSAVNNVSEAKDRLLKDRSIREQALQAKIHALESERKVDSERYAAEAKEKDAVLKETNEAKEKLFREQTARNQALQAKIDFLESDSKSQSEHYAAMAKEKEAAIATATEATEKLRKEETLRRQLHNTIQELKGNIRVFCRVRPGTPPDGSPSKQAQIAFPDKENSTQIEIRGPDERNSLGKDITKTHPFAFDRVFSPGSTNQEVFDEISQLIQSSLDGYNVCIFAYGQTGSGKTYTMSAEDGMIPRALRMIYNNTKDLEDRGWKYTMRGSFVEVYNESLNDLLGTGDDSEKRKLEIKHDLQNSETTITNVAIVNLDSTDEVESILARAMAKRSVAATQANERSSRSHSVFMLTVTGENAITGEQSKGTLNLVDLAGSERLNQSKAEGARLKETQSINRSLSSLGDVIGALAQGKEGGHVPYRNSKLTNLLQFSLGGNSKTLMFCMVSPLKDHLSESLTTLRFAAKVNSTHIGRASKT